MTKGTKTKIIITAIALTMIITSTLPVLLNGNDSNRIIEQLNFLPAVTRQY